ncbi:hypothetical protein IFM89_021404 [Coptis chinensis]|uniref:Receptor-like serine/threonine-protein kinase n=1 Tax=Coptis chinensis TaxID=261450 RepID=A0A835IDM4_9MAGN|nr:hypothetical protein IFM89_021404 [Coptis chinensis]
MGTWVSFGSIGLVITCIFVLFNTCFASTRSIGQIVPGFKGSQMNYIDNNGLFLLSNDSNFALGFTTTPQDVTLFLLVVVHMDSSRTIWTANVNSVVQNSDNFVFDNNGNVYLQSGGRTVWSTGTTGKGATALELQDSGNLVLLGSGRSILWQSFSHPTDTLLSGQEFLDGMSLVSNPSLNNLSYRLTIESGDMLLYVNFSTPQPYWSMGKEARKTINKVGGNVSTASLVSNSWSFFDRSQGLLWQFIFSSNLDANVTWAAVLGPDGLISFYTLQSGGSNTAEPTKIPNDSCSTPESCDSYYVCYGKDNKCQCPSALSSRPNCSPGLVSPCNNSKDPMQLLDVGDKLDYFALEYVTPFSNFNLSSCKNACLKNCSCVVLFFETSSRNCYLFDQIGSLQQPSQSSAGFVSYIKAPSNGNTGSKSSGDGGRKRFPIVVIIVVVTILVIGGLLYGGFRYQKKNKKLPESPKDMSEEDNFLENLTGMPLRFSYRELEEATNSFALKLGQGGFGSVYQGKLKDGSEIAVKQLEGIGQGKKEFRAEVSIIGSIHHTHLVRLRGFCAEGSHRLLAYEYMANEKSDVYSYGMVLLELIGGRKNFDPSETSEKAHFPTYALKMAEERKLNEILDPNIKIDKEDESVFTAIQVALWCIQEDMYMRPSMSRVVQMLEGICAVPQPPTSSQMGSRLYSSFFKSISEECTTSSGTVSDCNNSAYLSAVRLSGPR